MNHGRAAQCLLTSEALLGTLPSGRDLTMRVNIIYRDRTKQAGAGSAPGGRGWVWMLVIAVLAVAGYTGLQRDRGWKTVPFRGDARSMLSRTLDGTPQRPARARVVYPYSVVPGGVEDELELRLAAERDPVVGGHYAGFNLRNASVVKLAKPRTAHVSYRIKDKVYWTKKRVTLQKGEKLLTDGTNYIRARCGNRVSDAPMAASTNLEPPEEVLDTPLLPQPLVALAKPIDPPVEDPAEAPATAAPAQVAPVAPVPAAASSVTGVPFFVFPPGAGTALVGPPGSTPPIPPGTTPPGGSPPPTTPPTTPPVNPPPVTPPVTPPNPPPNPPSTPPGTPPGTPAPPSAPPPGSTPPPTTPPTGPPPPPAAPPPTPPTSTPPVDPPPATPPTPTGPPTPLPPGTPGAPPPLSLLPPNPVPHVVPNPQPLPPPGVTPPLPEPPPSIDPPLPEPIPEPSTYALIGGGLIALALLARRKAKTAASL